MLDDADFLKYLEFEDLGPGIAFERHLERLFGMLGYQVEATASVGDFGADLIATRGEERVLIQAKRWGQPLGLKAIQEAAGARPHYRCTRAIVITTSSFTEAARALAISNDVELWDRRRYLQEAKDAMTLLGSAPARDASRRGLPFDRAVDQFEAARTAALESMRRREIDRWIGPGLPQTKDLLVNWLKVSRNVATLLPADKGNLAAETLTSFLEFLEAGIMEAHKGGRADFSYRWLTRSVSAPTQPLSTPQGEDAEVTAAARVILELRDKMRTDYLQPPHPSGEQLSEDLLQLLRRDPAFVPTPPANPEDVARLADDVVSTALVGNPRNLGSKEALAVHTMQELTDLSAADAAAALRAGIQRANAPIRIVHEGGFATVDPEGISILCVGKNQDRPIVIKFGAIGSFELTWSGQKPVGFVIRSARTGDELMVNRCRPPSEVRRFAQRVRAMIS